jgi:hypothetical protein
MLSKMSPSRIFTRICFKRNIFIYITLLSICSCRDNSGFINETPEYMKEHPECIVGKYYNYFTDGAVSYILLRADSTYVHVCKYGNRNYADSGKWTYKYNQGQNDIDFGFTLRPQKEEGVSNINTIYTGFYLSDCEGLYITEKSEELKLNFYKHKPSWGN